MDELIKRTLNGVSKRLSYGNRSLVENVERTEHSISKLMYMENIWNKSRSQWMLKFLTCSQADQWMRLRQVSAEMGSKRKAYAEAKFGYMKKLTEAKIKRNSMPDEEDEDKLRLLEIETAELEWQASEILIKVEGAMKEMESLSLMHDCLKEKIGDVSELEFEKLQTKAHIKRALMQATRNMRECGVIKEGNQEYLEQCGVCVTSARKEIEEYLKNEDDGVMNTSLLHSFLDAFADRYGDAIQVQAEVLGFDYEPTIDLTYQGV